ncbi:protein kinase [Streptomycetaceae bacterium NBC_01309]
MTGTPTRIGRYLVARRLGSGGMGEVFLAHSPAGDPVAVKVIRTDRLDSDTRARFEREALAARTVVTTNRVARFLEADPFAERPWLAMEFVGGKTLETYVDERGPLSTPLVASLGALLAEGLGAVHAADLLHRDLKPANIILGEYGPVVIDFGLAAFTDARSSLTHAGTIIGTVRCMPPEQANGERDITAAADVYALGTVLLYAAAGHYPYDGTTWHAVVTQVVNPDTLPDLAGVEDGLRALVADMLAPAPADRPTLDEVVARCADVMAAAGWTPVRARHALVERTAAAALRDTLAIAPETGSPIPTEDGAGAAPESLAPLAIDLAALPDALDSPASRGPDPITPGDGTPAGTDEPGAEDGAGGPPDRSGDDVHAVPPPPAPGRRASAEDRPARVPAATRVSAELRDAYSARRGL